FNGEYIRALSTDEFVAACRPWLEGTDTVPAPPWRPEDFDAAAFAAVAPLVQTRVAVLSEIVPLVDFLFLPEPPTDEAAWTKGMKEPAAAVLDDAITAYEALPEWRADALKSTLEQVG